MRGSKTNSTVVLSTQTSWERSGVGRGKKAMGWEQGRGDRKRNLRWWWGGGGGKILRKIAKIYCKRNLNCTTQKRVKRKHLQYVWRLNDREEKRK